MELEIEEETVGKMGVVLIGLAILAIVTFFFAILTDPTKASLIQDIVCGIIWWMPGGGSFTFYFNCSSVPI